MEPVSIAIICAVVFGTVVAVSAFVRQLMLSRDKKLNDEAQERALDQEARTLERLRREMENRKRFDSHYQVLGGNKEAVQYLDQKIEETIKKKSDVINRYAVSVQKESSAIINGLSSSERKLVLDKLRDEIDNELQFYDKELEQLQQRRGVLWDTHTELQYYLLDQEKSRNDHLDKVYEFHTALLEKIYLRHNENSEHVAVESIQAGTATFREIVLAPLQLLLGYFSLSSGIAADKVKEELKTRDEVADLEKDINGDEPDDVFPEPEPDYDEDSIDVDSESLFA